MRPYRRWFRLASGRPDDLRRETDEEIDTHLALRTEDLIAGGMDPEAARAEAERRFGSVHRERRRLYVSARRRERRIRWATLGAEIAADIRLGVRRAKRQPGHSLAVVGIYALGIGLATTMFAFFDNVLLRPLPYPDPGRLVSLQSVSETGTPFDQASMANWVDWRAGAGSLAYSGLYRTFRVSASVAGMPLRATGTGVSGDFFRAIRPRFAAGRPFSDDEGQRGDAVAVVSSTFARSRLGGLESAIGRSLTVSGRSYEVIGVVDAREALPEHTDVWTPERWQPGSGGMRNLINYRAVGRLAEGSSIEQARTELDAVALGIRERDPAAAYSWGVGVLPLRDVLVHDARSYLRMLMAAVLGVLLVACANLAGLALAQARNRERETAVRLAIGSGRSRLGRQLMTTHATLAAAGGAAGALVALVATEAIAARVRVTIPRVDAVTVDLRVLGFAAVLSLFSGLAAGALPSIRATRVDPGRGLTDRSLVRGGRGLPGRVLVATEVALALTLLIGGGLLLRSFGAVVARDLGYEPEGVLTTEVTLVGDEYDGGVARLAYWSTLLESLTASPAIASAGIGNWIPTGGSGTGFIALPDDPEPDFGAGYRVISEGYFDTMGMGLVAGRGFDESDGTDGPRVTVVNRALAERAWPGQSAVGQRIRAVSMEGPFYDGEAPWLTVVGVVGDVRHGGFEVEPVLEMYVLYRQVPEWTTSMTAVIRAEPAAPASVSEAVRERIATLDRSLPVELAYLDRRLLDLLAERRLVLSITIGFASTAVFLVILGVYGLVSFSAAQRNREMAIRSALGAARPRLLADVLASAARVLGLGALIGLLVAGRLAGLMQDLLVDVPPVDPPTYLACAVLLVTAGLAAALTPALRASRADPATVLADG